jgi:hypothetical protein
MVQVLMRLLRNLEDAGIEVRAEPTHADTRVHFHDVISLRVDERTVRFLVEYRKRSPYRSELSGLTSIRDRLAVHGTPLLAVPFVSQGTGKRLTEAGWSWADESGNFDLRTTGIRLHQRLTVSEPTPHRLSLPKGSGSWAVIRWLLVRGDITSLTKLALEAHVSQPRVSQVLQQLEELGLIDRTTRSRWHPDREALLERFLREYPGPGGSTSYLYTLDSPLDCAIRLAKQRPMPSMMISGDIGVDLLVSWRRPTHLIVYTEAPIDLVKSIEVTVAHGLGDANVIHRVPEDRSVFAIKDEVDVMGVPVPLADPVQLIWESSDLGGDDRIEAAERLRTWLLRH